MGKTIRKMIIPKTRDFPYRTIFTGGHQKRKDDFTLFPLYIYTPTSPTKGITFSFRVKSTI